MKFTFRTSQDETRIAPGGCVTMIATVRVSARDFILKQKGGETE